MRRNTPCVFPAQHEKRDDRQSNDEYVRSLKDRLVRVESLLRTAGILQESDLSQDDFSDGDDDGPASQGFSSTSSPKSNFGSSVCSKGGFIEGTPIFPADQRDDSRYYGGDIVLIVNSIADRSEVFSLMKDFFRTVNRLFPIYHEPSFMKMVEWQYTQQTCDDAARWANINMVICLAYEYRSSNSSMSEKDKEKSELYFKNAMSVFTELALKRTDLLSIQALISMAFFLRGNSGTQSALPLITAAMRSSHRMGLHRDIARPELSPAEQEERRRVFWVAFVIDQSTCLRIGNTPSQHHDDFDVPLPQELDGDKHGETASKIPFFRELCQMSLIKSHIYSRLYSVTALEKPPAEIYKTVKELHEELEEWKRGSPTLNEPQMKPTERDFLFGFAAIGLHFVYHNALMMIHRIPIFLNYMVTARKESEKVQSISKAHASRSAAIAAQAARDTLKVVNNMPWGDIAWTWSLLYYVFLAASTLFSHILRDTRHSRVRADLQSIGMVSSFFATLAPGEGSNNYAGFMARMSASLERIAKAVIEKDEKRARAPDEEDQEYKPPPAKRHTSRTQPAPQHQRQHRRPTTLRTTMTPATAPGYPTSSTAELNRMDISIPDTLEGLPPVNSSGYVVPVSPLPGPGDSRQIPTPYLTNPYSPSTTFLHEAGDNPFQPPQIPSWQLSHDFSTTAAQAQAQAPGSSGMTPNPINSINSPDSFTSAANSIPDFFQYPMSGDWSHGRNLFGGLFPTEYTFPPPIPTGTQSADAYPSVPILSAESFIHGAPPIDSQTAQAGGFDPQSLGYGYVPQGQEDPNQAADPVWPNGFLGLF
ncbi:Transcription factor, fungi [Penicillium expansum]|uniref:Transcription factor, fungi n=1 Tax=Penicillium expansum TaxID=27334 RepID=A0A0A2J669_PENEN|nr:Transcription factor, fungi [Penicillium expansum]KGO41313.1 Transcription factor, fungi [Penicillium expansum]KGO50148.1 Transcription factor, fungi [Penicillium expansum]KGO59098.1 Transcription factor, fungi [Penicillium expansum]